MEFLWLWIIMGIVVGIIAGGKGHSFFAWGFYGLVIWPIALVHILVTKPNAERVEAKAVGSGSHKKCPACAEMVKAEARICRFCRHEFAETSTDQSTGVSANDVVTTAEILRRADRSAE